MTTRLLAAALPLALAACATNGTATRTPPPQQKLVVQPAQTVNTTPPLHKPKAKNSLALTSNSRKKRVLMVVCSALLPTTTLPKNSAKWATLCTNRKCVCPTATSKPLAKARCKSPCTPMWWLM